MSTPYYSSEWKSIEQLMYKKGAYQDARTRVLQVYERAKKEGNEAQELKALFVQLELMEVLELESDQAQIAQLEKWVASNTGYKKAILESLLAETYWKAYREDAWTINQRTVVAGGAANRDAWSSADYQKAIHAHYQASLQPREILQKVPVQKIDSVLIQGNKRVLRPTLYDLLAHRALDYYEEPGLRTTQSNQSFSLNNAMAFSPADDFMRRKFTPEEPLNPAYCAITLYQQLLRFHESDPDPRASIDIELRRYAYLRRQAAVADREQAYFQGINHLAHQYNTHPAATPVWVALAEYQVEQAEKYSYQQKDVGTRYAYVEAKKICEEVLAREKSGFEHDRLQALLARILHAEIEFQTESVLVPNQPFKTLVNYRNVARAYAFVFAADADAAERLEEARYKNTLWSLLQKQKPIQTQTYTLPATGDHQMHAVEVKLDALPAGEYILLIQTEPEINEKNRPCALSLVQVSSISFVQQEQHGFVLDRQTGKPLANAKVTITYKRYNNQTRKRDKEIIATLTSDEQGRVDLKKAPLREDYSGFEFIIQHGKESWSSRSTWYHSYQKDYFAPGDIPKVQLFTDRSIYRPGQTVQFKGIVGKMDPKTGRKQVVSNHTSHLILKDANGQKVDTLLLTTNSFGSYTGQFRLPEGGLNGRFTLEDKSLKTSIPIQVEAYKRPLFFVKLAGSKNEYALRDTVQIKGMATAYAGNAIQGAKVTYMVKRTPRWQYPWWSRWMPEGSQNTVVLAQGNTETQADGSFLIPFVAEPDPQIKKSDYPLFRYQIEASVTDLNGEQRSAEMSLQLGYQGFQVGTNLSPNALVSGTDLSKLQVTTRNFQGEPVQARLQASLQKIQQPARPFRARYWPVPDQYLYTQTEHRQWFPDDEYKHENDPDSWARGAIALTKDIATSSAGVDTPFQQSPSVAGGWYLLRIEGKDQNQESIQYEQYVHVMGAEWHGPDPLSIQDLKDKAVPGSTLNYTLQSQSPLHVIRSFEQRYYSSKASDLKSFELSPVAPQTQLITLSKEPGATVIAHHYVWKNRVYHTQQACLVMPVDTSIQIEKRYFRDKTLPGQSEQVRLVVKKEQDLPVAAEWLVSMYDQSLDQFKPHVWKPGLDWPLATPYLNWLNHGFEAQSAIALEEQLPYIPNRNNYDQLKSPIGNLRYQRVLSYSMAAPSVQRDALSSDQNKLERSMGQNKTLNEVVVLSGKIPGVQIVDKGKEDEVASATGSANKVRSDFRETAFFQPQLRSLDDGSIEISYTLPDALTTWKLQAVAHDQNLHMGYWQGIQVTQKDLMVQPNLPRFFRQGDRMELSTKIVNLSKTEITGQVTLRIKDALTGENVDGVFNNIYRNQYFTVEAGGTNESSFSIQVPHQYPHPVEITFEATGPQLRDAEAHTLPVLTNRSLITESMPLYMKGSGTKTFDFSRLANIPEDIENKSLTVEYTSNPAWLVVQALPYLQQYPYECTEQTFNRYFALRLSAHLAKKIPNLASILKAWKQDSSALLSALAQNPALKQALLTETPWVVESLQEGKNKGALQTLLNSTEIEKSTVPLLDKLLQMQQEDGGFSWFSGGRSNWYITQYVLSSIAHLQQLAAIPEAESAKLKTLIEKAILFIDEAIEEDYLRIQKLKPSAKQSYLTAIHAHYLYTRSYYRSPLPDSSTKKAIAFFKKQAMQFWLQQGLYEKGLIALALDRSGEEKTARLIVENLRQTSFYSEDQGRYWKSNLYGWHWQEAPIETQALLIEVFDEIAHNETIVNELRQWLITQKETHHWPSTKSTAAACFALVQKGTPWLDARPEVMIQVGPQKISSATAGPTAGLGYFQQSIPGALVNESLRKVVVTVDPKGSAPDRPSFGAVYWQYFQPTDRVTAAGKNLQVTRNLFKEKQTDKGKVLQALSPGDAFQVGDILVVKIEIRTDRSLDFVHVKDSRSAATEPVSVLSGYRWQGGAGYYENIRDTGTDFFFDYLPKGTQVLEYRLRVQQKGTLQAGITQVQCLYAPRFVAHSNGAQIVVE